jgi:hypothetical protein
MNEEDPHSDRPWAGNGWFALALLAVLIGIEFIFTNGSKEQIYAIAGAVLFFGAIIAWRTYRSNSARP